MIKIDFCNYVSTPLLPILSSSTTLSSSFTRTILRCQISSEQNPNKVVPSKTIPTFWCTWPNQMIRKEKTIYWYLSQKLERGWCWGWLIVFSSNLSSVIWASSSHIIIQKAVPMTAWVIPSSKQFFELSLVDTEHRLKWFLIGGWIVSKDEKMSNALFFSQLREKNLEVDPCTEDPGYSFQAGLR